jgi:hypothetical protein
MNFLEQLRNLTAWDITAVLGGFLATVAPGLLIVYLFDPALVLKLETMKLFVFSAAITLPVLAVNAFAMLIVGIWMGIWSKGTVTRQHLFFYEATWAFLTLYAAVLIAFLCSLNVSQFIWVVGGVDVVVGVAVMFVVRELAESAS